MVALPPLQTWTQYLARPNAMIAIKLPEGMSFGRVRKVSVSRILFEIASELKLGQQLDWRMELTGWNATVLGRLQIMRIQVREERPDLVEARIVHIDGAEARAFRDWLAELSVGGTTRRYDSNPSSVSGIKRSRMTGTSRAQITHALKQIDGRSLGGQKGPSDAFGLTSQLSSVMSNVEAGISGRKAMSAALKASLKSGGRRTRSVPTSEEAIEISPSPSLSVPEGPQVELGNSGGGLIRVIYGDRSTFLEDWRKHIKRSGLFIQEHVLGQRGAERSLELVLPSGRVLTCKAEIVAPMPSGTGLALKLRAAQLRVLQEEAGLTISIAP
jgi:hypothetical protein